MNMTPANGIEALASSLSTEIGAITPYIVDAAGSTVGAIAPSALTIMGMVAVVGIIFGVFRRLMRG
jgi:hypothetical protein